MIEDGECIFGGGWALGVGVWLRDKGLEFRV